MRNPINPLKPTLVRRGLVAPAILSIAIIFSSSLQITFNRPSDEFATGYIISQFFCLMFIIRFCGSSCTSHTSILFNLSYKRFPDREDTYSLGPMGLSSRVMRLSPLQSLSLLNDTLFVYAYDWYLMATAQNYIAATSP